MKRDMAIIRALLEYVEQACKGDREPIPVPSCDQYSYETLYYHVGLCLEAGFIQGEKITFADAAPQYQMMQLTWKGQEKLAELRKARTLN